jgi:hypothetical protein
MAPEPDKRKRGDATARQCAPPIGYNLRVPLPRTALVASIVLPAATLVPYLYGAHLAAPGRAFTWLHSLNARDTYTYLAWIEQALRGHLLFRDLFTSEASRPVLFHPLFLTLGLLARVTGLSSMAAFHAARLLLGSLLVLLLSRLVRRFVPDGTPARVVFLYLLVSGGVGWAFLEPGALLTSGPPDLWMPEAFVFLSLLESPLFLCAWCLLAAIILEVVPAKEGSAPRLPRIALLALGLGFVHPYEVITMAAVFAVAIALGIGLGRPVPRGLPAALGALVVGAALPVLYQGLVLSRDPIFGSYVRSAFTPSPSPWRFLLAFLPSIALGAIAVPRVLARRRPRDLLLLAWPVATTILLYAPTDVQRRFALGVQIPLAILAGIGVFEVLWPLVARRATAALPRTRHRRLAGAVLLVAALAASALSGVTVVRADIAAYRSAAYPQYVPAEFVRVARRFGETTKEDAVLFCDPSLGYFVPGLTGRRVFAGHYDLTIGLPAKLQALRAFFDAGSSDEARREFLGRAGITHVLHSPVERDLGSFDPGGAPYLELAAADGQVRLFRVRTEALAP